MRLHVYMAAAMLLSTVAGVAAHADILSTYRVANQSGVGDVGTVTIDSTTGLVTDADISLVVDHVPQNFAGAPVSQSYNLNLLEYQAFFTAPSGDEFLFQVRDSSLVGYAPNALSSCVSSAVNCDYLADVFNAPVPAGRLVDTFEGNLTSSASVTPEPNSIALLATGLVGVAGVIRRRMA